MDPAATATGGEVVPVLDVSEDSEFSSPTCSKEDPGVPDGDPSFPLSVEDQPVRGSDYVLEEAWYWARNQSRQARIDFLVILGQYISQYKVV